MRRAVAGFGALGLIAGLAVFASPATAATPANVVHIKRCYGNHQNADPGDQCSRGAFCIKYQLAGITHANQCLTVVVDHHLHLLVLATNAAHDKEHNLFKAILVGYPRAATAVRLPWPIRNPVLNDEFVGKGYAVIQLQHLSPVKSLNGLCVSAGTLHDNREIELHECVAGARQGSRDSHHTFLIYKGGSGHRIYLVTLTNSQHKLYVINALPQFPDVRALQKSPDDVQQIFYTERLHD